VILCVVSMEGSGATSIPPTRFLVQPKQFLQKIFLTLGSETMAASTPINAVSPPPKRQSCYRLPSASTPSVRCCKQTILVPQVLATICLSEARNTSWIQSPCFLCAPGCDTKTERCIIHAINNNSLMLWAIFTPAPDLCLYNV
jgi:hypothetical protein